MSPPNQQIQKHIDSSQELIQKLADLTDSLQQQLFRDFQNTMGVAIPTAVQADVREVEYTMVYATDPVFDSYMQDAKTILDGVFAENWPDVADKALDVVGTVLNGIVGKGTIQTGLHSESGKYSPKEDPSKSIVSACFAEVEECSASDWATESNFYVSYYAYVCWQPNATDLAAIMEARPALASA